MKPKRPTELGVSHSLSPEGEGGGGISGDHMVFKENGEGICRGQQSIKRGLLTIDRQLTVEDRGS